MEGLARDKMRAVEEGVRAKLMEELDGKTRAMVGAL
jgi:hypothetical protein